MTTKNNPKGRGNDIVVQELKDEVMIYDLTINKAYCLNPTSAAIWNLCDGNNSVSVITEQLSKILKQPITDDLVYLALDQFKTDNLLSESNEIEIKFDGLSRREVIRKVGFASMVALPVIASLVAPTAAMAQSVGTCAGTISDIPCGASTNTGFFGDCNACLASLPSCCPNQVVAAPACTAGAAGCTSCTRTCA